MLVAFLFKKDVCHVLRSTIDNTYSKQTAGPLGMPPTGNSQKEASVDYADNPP